jgi:type II secretory pathway pseudopilin PulG
MVSKNLSEVAPVRPESGFGVIEIVVSLMLLAVLAVAMLPTFVGSLTNSARNSSLATATQIVDQQLELARSAGDTCVALDAYEAALPAAVSDSRGVTYSISRSVDCPAAAYPSTVRVTVSVSPSGSSAPDAAASTLVYVGAP